ncbi:hypothetical protein PFC_05335 [Pyrococcus furiosus COM1]|uniref:PIN domain-containing protein n=1 Tax=Pyrococcus furiosus COM1 TaxID=1185654 RepID=I6U7M0_9EURY|nr:hypothetical protein PFC_05335 [Pyrococcus furiosus COM1]
MIIEIARGNRRILEKVLSTDSTFYITSITKFEIFLGFPKKEELIWLNSLEELPFDGKSAEIAAYLYKKLREKGIMLGIRDLFIGSIALVNDLPLITLDKDFLHLKEFGLEVEILR